MTIYYMIRSPERPRLYCLPIRDSAFEFNDPRDPTVPAPPPLKCTLAYMVLTEMPSINSWTGRDDHKKDRQRSLISFLFLLFDMSLVGYGGCLRMVTVDFQYLWSRDPARARL
jgi:hypothetical protein